jgi:hypothetical protein
MTSLAPSLAKAKAVALPIPDPPPVINATLPPAIPGMIALLEIVTALKCRSALSAIASYQSRKKPLPPFG